MAGKILSEILEKENIPWVYDLSRNASSPTTILPNQVCHPYQFVQSFRPIWENPMGTG